MNDQTGYIEYLQVKEAQRNALLIAGYIRQTLTPDEHDKLDEWVGASDENMPLSGDRIDTTQVRLVLDSLSRSDAPGIAASQQDVLPGGDKAMLTLADGSTIILEQAEDGTLATQGVQLVYNTAGRTPGAQLFNTVTIPWRGSYSLTLSDGTNIWLNAASSIRFPAAVTGSEKRVAITGEVYFVVAKNSAMSFKVEVLGTHFNINAYNEADIQTILPEGLVKVLNGPKKEILKPGQQAQLDAPGNRTITTANM